MASARIHRRCRPQPPKKPSSLLTPLPPLSFARRLCFYRTMKVSWRRRCCFCFCALSNWQKVSNCARFTRKRTKTISHCVRNCLRSRLRSRFILGIRSPLPAGKTRPELCFPPASVAAALSMPRITSLAGITNSAFGRIRFLAPSDRLHLTIHSFGDLNTQQLNVWWGGIGQGSGECWKTQQSTNRNWHNNLLRTKARICL